MGHDAIFAAKTLPRLRSFVQMSGFLGGILVKMSAPNRPRDETGERFGLISDPAEHWSQVCNGNTSHCSTIWGSGSRCEVLLRVQTGVFSLYPSTQLWCGGSGWEKRPGDRW